MAFWTLGIITFLQSFSEIKIFSRTTVFYLAGFAILNGLLELIIMFQIFEVLGIANATPPFLDYTAFFLRPLSYILLLMFGCEILIDLKLLSKIVRQILTITFAVIFAFYCIINPIQFLQNSSWIDFVSTYSKYFLALPASLVSAFSMLAFCRKTNLQLGHRAKNILKFISLLFLIYGAASVLDIKPITEATVLAVAPSTSNLIGVAIRTVIAISLAILFSDLFFIEIRKVSKIISDHKERLETRAAFFENTSEAILVTDLNGNIQEVNQGFEKITGYSRKEVIGKNPSLLKSGKQNPTFYLELWVSLIKLGNWKGELINRRKNGELYHQLTSITSVKNSENKVIQYVSVGTDITERVKAEEQIHELNVKLQEATNAKTNFLSNMSHEIRTPLNSIIGFAEVLEASHDPKIEKDYLSRISKSGHSLLELINNILDISKIESSNLALEEKVFELKKLITEAFGSFELQALKKGLKLELIFKSQLPEIVKGDPLRIRQIILNILGNSLKFTEHGFCKLEVSAVPQKHSHCLIRITISDSGIGIPANKLDLLFTRFTQVDSSITRKFGGSGLGLNISRELLRLMGGSISVRSELEKGTAFDIIFPLKIESKLSADSAVKFDEFNLLKQNLKILVVDDVEENRILLEAFLKKSNCLLDFATRGDEAVERYKLNRYDLILMDMQMPIMDGFTATKIIRNYEESNSIIPVPIIAITGFALNVEKEKCLAAGCTTYISKPIQRRTLLETISSLFNDNSILN